MKITADQTRCAGTAMCVSVAAKNFRLDPGNRRVVVLTETPSPEDQDDVEEAVELCPTRALKFQ